MSSRASATRYARALLDVVIKEAEPAQVGQQLATLASLFNENTDLQKALTNPAVPVTAKRGIVQELAKRLEMAPPAAKLLLMLADRDRLALIPALNEVYAARLREHQQVITAEITTAAPLSPERAAQLQQRLSQATGRTITMTTSVDPELIGGAVARVGSTVFDGSIAAQLQQLRDRLQQQR
jgi:F-type H+-transporting ATPase subunit delta